MAPRIKVTGGFAKVFPSYAERGIGRAEILIVLEEFAFAQTAEQIERDFGPAVLAEVRQMVVEGEIRVVEDRADGKVWQGYRPDPIALERRSGLATVPAASRASGDAEV